MKLTEIVDELVVSDIKNSLTSIIRFFFEILALLTHNYSIPECPVLLATRSFPYVSIPRISNFQYFMEHTLDILKKGSLNLYKLRYTIVNEIPEGILDSF